MLHTGPASKRRSPVLTTPAVGTDNPGNPGPETALGLETRVRGRRPGHYRGQAGSPGPQTPACSRLRPMAPLPQGRTDTSEAGASLCSSRAGRGRSHAGAMGLQRVRNKAFFTDALGTTCLCE